MPDTTGIHYFFHPAEEGTPKRPPVLLIHGAGGNHLSWHPYIRRLRGETVYTLNLPGHGLSQPPGRRTIDEYADDIFQFMNELGIQSAVLGGISMGSAIALTLALEHPERISGLMLIGGGAKMRVARLILETIGDPKTFESAADAINSNFFSASASQDLLRLSRQGLLKSEPSVLLNDFLACNQFDVTDRLKEINMPVLVMCGTEDKMMPPKYSEFLRDNLPNAQLSMIEQAGHMVQLEQPNLVANAMKQFLDEIPLHATL
jgi:pimeloyl-ACP methyl ester carboxylesterase